MKRRAREALADAHKIDEELGAFATQHGAGLHELDVALKRHRSEANTRYMQAVHDKLQKLANTPLVAQTHNP